MILFILVKPNIRSQIILRLDITAELRRNKKFLNNLRTKAFLKFQITILPFVKIFPKIKMFF